MANLTDPEIRDLLILDSGRGWRAFVDRYTPTLLALIERAGITDYDEAMELYLSTCERLSADNYGRLLQRDPAKGPIGVWLATVVRHVIVDWVRARAGRRRLFHAIEALAPLVQETFKLYYWNDHGPSEICEMLSTREGRPVTLAEVFDALDTIDAALSDRHRRELLAMAVRSRAPASLEAQLEEGSLEPRAPGADPETALRVREVTAALNAALASLAPEDAAIVRLKYVQGLTHHDIERALHLDRLTDARVKRIVAQLRARLTASNRSAT